MQNVGIGKKASCARKLEQKVQLKRSIFVGVEPVPLSLSHAYYIYITTLGWWRCSSSFSLSKVKNPNLMSSFHWARQSGYFKNDHNSFFCMLSEFYILMKLDMCCSELLMKRLILNLNLFCTCRVPHEALQLLIGVFLQLAVIYNS